MVVGLQSYTVLTGGINVQGGKSCFSIPHHLLGPSSSSNSLLCYYQEKNTLCPVSVVLLLYPLEKNEGKKKLNALLQSLGLLFFFFFPGKQPKNPATPSLLTKTLPPPPIDVYTNVGYDCPLAVNRLLTGSSARKSYYFLLLLLRDFHSFMICQPNVVLYFHFLILSYVFFFFF